MLIGASEDVLIDLKALGISPSEKNGEGCLRSNLVPLLNFLFKKKNIWTVLSIDQTSEPL